VGAQGVRREDAEVSVAKTTPVLGPQQRKQIALISVGALAVFVFMRFLPTGTNLNHMDFRVSGQNSIEFCDPTNPQFIPVVSVRSPVSMTVEWDSALQSGQASRGVIMLKTASGKPIEAEDLLIAHTRKLHLLFVDPTLTDYQHLHPEPGAKRGEWLVTWTPRLSGAYRIFADFTPAATARGLYASAEAQVANGQGSQVVSNRDEARKPYAFALTPAVAPLKAGQPADLKFTIVRHDGGPVPMQPVMGAFAHLVAFDEARSGFAHLHPMETDLLQPPNATRPELNFKITIPQPGRYVIWAQVNLGGQELFAPFEFQVTK
jgi:hypothetical protein